MRFLTSAAITAFSLVAATPAYAQSTTTSTGLPNSVLWVAGLAAFLGFLVGSVPPRGENRGWTFDSQGALMWAIATGSIAGGITYIISSATWFPGLWACLLGSAFSLMRIVLTRPPRVPTNFDLEDGINRAQHIDPRRRLRLAKKMFKNASFHDNNGRYATRAPREWYFDSKGPSQQLLHMLHDAIESHEFNILVILVRELPFESGQPAVIVVRGANQLLATRIGAGSITPPSGPALPAANIEALVGYAWR